MDYICSVCGKKIIEGLQDNNGHFFCSMKCYEKTLPKCAVCGKHMHEWIEVEDGTKYCSEACINKVLPKCATCGKPVNGGIISEDGKVYCDDFCYEKSLPTCAVCGKHMHEWIEVEDGTKYCSEACINKVLPKCATCGKPVNGGIISEDGKVYCDDFCYEKSLPTCAVCGKHMHEWLEKKDGTKYCSEACLEATLPKCSVCGKPIHKGYTDQKNRHYCSMACFEKTLPKCTVCGKPVNGGCVDQEGHHFCSDECYEKTLPKCAYCGKRLTRWIETENGEVFCNNDCLEASKQKHQIEMESPLTDEELAYLTGLTVSECRHFMDINHMNGDDALETIDIFMEALNDNVPVPVEVASCLYAAGIYTKMASRLNAYNTMRGGVKGYGGFVFEELHSADSTIKGLQTTVLGDNGVADFIVKDSSGKEILVQAKAGYKPHQIDWGKYQGQTIVVDKGNTALANEARSAGLQVQESAIFKKEANIVARAQQLESKLTGSKNAPIVGTATGAHYAGVASAKLAARVGVSMKLGENIYDFLSGHKDFSEAASDVLVDGVVIVGSAYFGGAALTMAGTAASMLAGTTAGVAITGAAAGVTTAIGATAAGSAIVTGVGAITTGAASVAAAVASAPLLPIVAAGAAIGFIGKWLRDR